MYTKIKAVMPGEGITSEPNCFDSCFLMKLCRTNCIGVSHSPAEDRLVFRYDS